MNHRLPRSRHGVVALLATATFLLAASPALAGSWQDNFAFGAALQGDLYTPTKLASPPAILVVIHMCTGHSTTVHGWFDSAADTNGFYLIAPDAGKQCFDASASRTGDKAAIVTMVNYLITQKGADKTRVFATGMSSGGCMTNTLLAIYPDVFAGGSAMPGFPAGTWPAGDTTCTKCGSTPPTMTAAQWGALATNVFQWSGQRPCSQQWVGGGDQYNFDGYLPDVVLQFQYLSSLGSGMAGTGSLSGWTRTVYKDSSGDVRLETNLGPTSQMHDLENLGAPLYSDVVTFLGLDKATGACGLTTSSTGTGSGGASGGTGSGGTTGSGGSGGKGGGMGGAAGGKGGTTGSSGTGGAAGGHGGTTATGGTTGTGTGGTTGVGGAAGKAGTTGTTGTGGTTVTGAGGTTAAAGGSTGAGTGGGTTTGSGGSASGGANGEGGTQGEGGSPATGGTTGDSSAGCSCAVDGAGHTPRGPLAMLIGMALALAWRRRRTRR